jgi:hypothetical protein
LERVFFSLVPAGSGFEEMLSYLVLISKAGLVARSNWGQLGREGILFAPLFVSFAGSVPWHNLGPSRHY